MTPPLARHDAEGTQRRRVFATLVLALAASAAAAPASANPLPLQSDADRAAFLAEVRAYRDASRVRWVIAAPDRADALAELARVEAQLPPSERDLASRITAQVLDAADATGTVRAWMQPQFSASGAANACSWQVWVTDPAFPSPSTEPVSTPLSPNDRLPVGPAATFRVGHAGLLQSRLYAFGETHAGAIRDLATAPEVNVPVSTEPGGETLVLATSREATPFLESLKSALADSEGKRLDLGVKYALRDKMAGKSRGIGANIQAIPQSMIADSVSQVAVNTPARDETAAGKLVETCSYVLIPTQ
jgi:hypothetical protein